MKKIKMKANLISAFLIILLTSAMMFAPAAFAAETNLVDDAGLLSEADFEYVKNYIEDISESRQFDIVVVTTEGYSQSDITAFADDFFDYNGYGYGEGRDGVIFAIDMLGRQFVLTTSGSGIDAITDYGEEYIYDQLEGDIRAGDYRSAFTTGFADSVVYLLNEYEAGNVYDIPAGDGDYDPGYTEPEETKANMATLIGTSLIFGLIVGLFSSLRHKSALKTVRKQYQANNYARQGSLVLTAEKDRYLYTNVVVRPKPEKPKNSGSGGGTTVHTSSSGRSHGGGHARGF